MPGVSSARSPFQQRLGASFFAVASFSLGCFSALLVSPASAAGPFNSATVSRIENAVSVGDRASGAKKSAQLQESLNANSFVVTEDSSRAELTFPDGSLARIGQNTVFTFDSSRTLDLQKGAMLFYVPPKTGNATTIRTPALTAAITGTVGLVSETLIAVLIGEITLPDGRVVHAGEAVEANGTDIRIFRFDPASIQNGYLVQMGPLPESPFTIPAELQGGDIPRELLRLIERGEITQVDPRVRVPKPKPEPPKEEEPDKPKMDDSNSDPVDYQWAPMTGPPPIVGY